MLFKLNDTMTITEEQLNAVLNKLLELPGRECFNAIRILTTLPRAEEEKE